MLSKLADGFQFVDNFLLFYASVLEPYRHLSLGQVCLGRYPPPFVLRDKFVGGILAFEFLQLHLSVRDALFPSASVRAGVSPGVRSRIWGEDRQSTPLWAALQTAPKFAPEIVGFSVLGDARFHPFLSKTYSSLLFPFLWAGKCVKNQNPSNSFEKS